MHTPFTVIALCAGALALTACDKTPDPPPPIPMVRSAPSETGATSAPVGDPSVPSAGSVLAPPDVAATDPASQRKNATMSAAQESTAMPMPGQNNDHSVPPGPTRPASAP